LRLRPKLKDVGEYSEMFKITNKNSSGPSRMVKFLIIVLAPKEKVNLTCPFGKKLADCMPKIANIDDLGIITV
jgi:hypothetical protein